MFYTQLFTLKRGPLARIWLAAHWEKKITKMHVFECNLEATIKDIISPEVIIGLRISGHLLLGVVRIYFRKAKYLLSDCTDAVVKIKVAFRPGQTDLPSESLEASFKAITLPEDFTDFELQLPNISDIDFTDHFTLNQCKTEDITLKEDYGSSFHVLESDFGDEANFQEGSILDGSFHSLAPRCDGFGDEDTDFTLLDLMVNSNEDAMPMDVFSVGLNNEVPAAPPPTAEPKEAEHQETGSEAAEEHAAVSETILLENEEEAFALEPVSVLSSTERKRGKSKRRLLVDSVKELSNEAIRRQIEDCSDLLVPLSIAPPTRQLMEWKMTGGVHRLFCHLCVPVIHPQLQQLFPSNMMSIEWWKSRRDREQDWEEMRDQSGVNESMLAAENTGLLSGILDLDSTKHSLDHLPLIASEEHNSSPSQCNSMNEESRTEFTFPEMLSEVLLPNMPDSSHTQDWPEQSTVNSQDFEEKMMNHRTHRLLHFLRQNQQSSGSTVFSLHELCKGCNRTMAATTFFCLLVLKKRGMLELHQDTPYADVIGTLRPAE
ncbi:double-strand-break repair protein rad21-like protein 1 isoform X3 [Brienomyrus brachyistius]|uniref:double-strand-break repair protein rad21-like protein 1 isoform X3 n=1 Tax=Brienomyrus brachyistius TaxID=42636 RepID=UPI0020B3034B|nr:double-strand-break repair protein rad21-like protein 1 isoform X3 [Brienomyrus brachyistius]